MKKRFFNCIITILCIISFFSSCVTNRINYQDMDLTVDSSSRQILNLKYFGDREIVRQSESLMKEGLLNTNSEEYGYYYISFHGAHSNYNIFNFYEGWGDTLGIDIWFNGGGPYIGEAAILLFPILVVVYVVVGTLYFAPLAVATPLVILGAPTDYADFDITAELIIFDSNGNLVTRLEESGSFKQAAGIYYGHDPIKKANISFSELYRKMFETANLLKNEINQVLMASGPITDLNSTQAMENINAYLDTF